MSSSPAPLVIGPLLDALRGVTWPARVRVRAGLPGAHRANQRGTSGEFTEFRAYRQGDDPRRIDWRLLARSDRAFVRVTDERAWWPTWIVVDASASMAFPASTVRSTSADKWTTARTLAVGLAAAAHASGDPVGLLVATRPDARRLAPRTRRGTVHAIARLLDDVTPEHASPLAAVLARLPAGARIAVVTDGLDDELNFVATLARTRAAGSDVTLVHVVHPLELDPPRGAWQALDPERPEERRALLPVARQSYQSAFEAWRTEYARRVLAAGARHVLVACDEAPARAVRRIVQAGVTSGAA